MPEQRDSGAWGEYERLVLSTLERHEDEIRDARKEIETLRIENASIKQQVSWRAGMYGFIGALVPILLMVAATLVHNWTIK